VDKFATKPDTERRDILQEAATRRGVSTIIMEKDFWVCWTLKRLFENFDLAQHITFKGATSLSKAYHLIERFSEDIDLTIGRAAPHVIRPHHYPEISTYCDHMARDRQFNMLARKVEIASLTRARRLHSLQ
jgi:hypothetical protein